MPLVLADRTALDELSAGLAFALTGDGLSELPAAA